MKDESGTDNLFEKYVDNIKKTYSEDDFIIVDYKFKYKTEILNDIVEYVQKNKITMYEPLYRFAIRPIHLYADNAKEIAFDITKICKKYYDETSFQMLYPGAQYAVKIFNFKLVFIQRMKFDKSIPKQMYFLSDIYEKLHNVRMYDKWQKLIEIENLYHTSIVSKSNNSKSKGGGNKFAKKRNNSAKFNNKLEKSLINGIPACLAILLLNNISIAIGGVHGYNHIRGKYLSCGYPQLFTAFSINEFIKQLITSCKMIKRADIRYDWKKVNLIDHPLVYFARFYINQGKTKKIIFDVYNYTQFYVVPVIKKNGILCLTKWPTLQFLNLRMIDYNSEVCKQSFENIRSDPYFPLISEKYFGLSKNVNIIKAKKIMAKRRK